MEDKVLEKALNEIKEYAERQGMVLMLEANQIKIIKDVTKEVEECVFDAVWSELRDAENVCEKSCLTSHVEPSAWQRKCIEVCIQCWEMTKRAECARDVYMNYAEHLYAVEAILKKYGLWYHTYSRLEIDEKVMVVIESKPPPNF